MKDVVRWTLYPVMLSSALLATSLAIRAGHAPAAVVAVVVSLSPIPVLLAQRWIPAEPTWRGRPKDFSIDLLHLAATGLATEGWRALTLGGVTALAVALEDRVGFGLWPDGWPMVVQFALGMAIGELLAYGVHRACHTWPLLWRLHAVHHSSERMYALAAARNHPANAVAMHFAHLLPLTLLGAPIEVMALVSVFTGVHGMLQHANLDLRHGWLNHVFSTADLHRWHHSAELEESNTNFGNNLIVWDTLFGTRRLPPGRPRAVGLGADHLPENFLWHLVAPLVLYRLFARMRGTVDADRGLESREGP